jgi:hypothetical protein
MLRTLGQIARLDRRWFRAHPERRHRCRWPDTVELDLWDNNRDARLVMAIRHLGRGHVVYQPVIFQGALPRDERSTAALFALAAISSEPIPVITLLDVLRLRRGLRRHTLSQEAFRHRRKEALTAPRMSRSFPPKDTPTLDPECLAFSVQEGQVWLQQKPAYGSFG